MPRLITFLGIPIFIVLASIQLSCIAAIFYATIKIIHFKSHLPQNPLKRLLVISDDSWSSVFCLFVCLILWQCGQMLCDKTFFGGEMQYMSIHPRLGAHDRPKYGRHQSPNWWTSKFYSGYYMNVNEGLLTGAGISQRQLHDQSPLLHEWQPIKLETCSILHSLQAAQGVESILSRCFSWWEPLPGSSAGLCFFHTAGLLSEFY